MLIYSDYVKELFDYVNSDKMVGRKADFNKLKRFCLYVDYFNVNIGRRTSSILGEALEDITVDSRIAFMFGPRCVTFKTEEHHLMDLMSKETTQKFNEDEMSIEEWDKLVCHVIGYFKTSNKRDAKFSDVFKKVTIADVKDVYVGKDVYVADKSAPVYPVDLEFSIYDEDEVDVKKEKAAVRALFVHMISNLTSGNTK